MYRKPELIYPPLFIVGAPRSGTTIVLQHLLNNYCFSYIPNISNKHFFAPLHYLSKSYIKCAYINNFNSNYGVIEGDMSPSDGWNIFNRFFYVYKDKIVRSRDLTLLARIVATIEYRFSLPFINKNNANSNRIKHLSVLFPDAMFLYVERDITPTVSSLLKARREHNISRRKWWGISPVGFAKRNFDSELERCVVQTYCVNKSIVNALSGLGDKRVISIKFEEFIRHPEIVLSLVSEQYRCCGVSLTKRGGEADLYVKRTQDVPEGLSEEIAGILEGMCNDC